MSGGRQRARTSTPEGRTVFKTVSRPCGIYLPCGPRGSRLRNLLPLSRPGTTRRSSGYLQTPSAGSHRVEPIGER